jgi:hypothetical protein
MTQKSLTYREAVYLKSIFLFLHIIYKTYIRLKSILLKYLARPLSWRIEVFERKTEKKSNSQLKIALNLHIICTKKS